MAYEVLARKWRPQSFDDMVGQEHVTRTLRNAVETGRIAHAYLFVGPRGVGKTSVARIFAKALNCGQGPTATPCGRCDACREIAAGTSLDVMEIDGASNNSVDQVRDLRDTIKFAPAHGQFKIYIIDEVHMLSVAAFNALLKTLEEPPAHVKFLFATTEPQKILPTILSRCQRFDLRRIPVPLIVERLKRIAASEGVTADGDALLAIARGAEGGLRDAESALDQLISFRGKALHEEDVLAVFGLVSRAALEELAERILRGDIKRLIEKVAALDQAGKDLQRLTVELMEHFRNLLVLIHAGDPGGVMDLTEAQVEVLRRQAGLTDSEKLLRLMGILTEVEDRMKHTLSRRTLLETALIRCARAATVVSLEEILAEINALRAQAGGRPAASPAGATGSARPPAPAPAAQPLPGKGAAAAAVAEARPAYGAAAATRPGGGDQADLAALLAQWPEVKAAVTKLTLAGNALRDARPLAVEGERVVIGVDREFADEIKGLEIPRNRKAVEQALSKALNRGVKAEFRLMEREPAVAEAEGETEVVTPAPAAVPPPAPPAPAAKTNRSAREWAGDPAVRKTLDMFDGTIVDVRE